MNIALPKKGENSRHSSAHAPRRRPSRLSDIWQAPLHDFPIRDEILCQFVSFSQEMDVLEIGPGSGFTAYWLSHRVRHMTLLDVASETIDELSEELRAGTNFSFVTADVTISGLAARLEERFDAAFGLDVFEYLADPESTLRNLAEVLRPGGELFLTFPNTPPPRGDGVTYFDRAENLEELLKKAGFVKWQILVVRPRAFSAAVYRVLHDRPLAIVRDLRRGNPAVRPQTYENTWAFSQREQLSRFKIPLHLYWSALGQAIRLGGQVFKSDPPTTEILGKQIVVRAWK